MENLGNVKKAKVYAIRFGDKGIYVGDCAQPTYKDVVHKHCAGKKALTCTAAQWCKDHSIKPELYELAMVEASDNVLQHKVAQVRWLLDQGQTVLVSDTVMTMAVELNVDADPVYQTIKHRKIGDVFVPENDLIRGRRTAAERRRNADDGRACYDMSVVLTPALRGKVECGAATRGVAMAEYIRQCIASDGGATVDMEPLIELTDRLISCSNALGALRDTVAATGIADAAVVSALQAARAEFGRCCADVQREMRTLCSKIESRK